VERVDTTVRKDYPAGVLGVHPVQLHHKPQRLGMGSLVGCKQARRTTTTVQVAGWEETVRQAVPRVVALVDSVGQDWSGLMALNVQAVVRDRGLSCKWQALVVEAFQR